MKILLIIALLLTNGCSTRANSNYIVQEIRTFYSGLLNGKDISITCMDRDYKSIFFKEMNKNIYKKEYKDIDSYVMRKHLDVAYTIKKDNKLMRCYHGKSRIYKKQFMNYFFTMSVPVDNSDDPHVEISSFNISDKQKVSLSIEVGKDNEYCYARVMDEKNKITYKEFKYCFDDQV